ncbi:hypothetical protein AXG55_06035 [Silvanigrella aquatica]|uniref:Uncharacterized protein n=2 Tax=Silvanigrella aquatica TaxID=1915309 RepID=A0A1L4CZW5_9BACT|nr:hypothetical protein AXG55_06035 [Silvanigrella aquatica]
MISLFLLHKTLIASYLVNISDNVPPQSGLNEKNIPEGLIIELSKSIFKEVNFSAYPLARALETTQKEKDSLLFVSRTQERENNFYWLDKIYSTEVYIYVNSGWIKKNGSSLNNINNLGVIYGSSLIQILKQKNFRGEISTVYSNDQNLKKLSSGRINGWIEGQIIAEYIIKKEKMSSKKFEKIGPIFENYTWIATSIKSNEKFIKQSKKMIEKFKKGEDYKVILKKFSAKNV